MRLVNITLPFAGERELNAWLALLTVANVLQMRWWGLPALYGQEVTRLDRRQVQYTRETASRCRAPVTGGCEDWLCAWDVNERGQGDCEDLACYRAAELILAGERARAIAQRTRAGWHIVVRRGDGTIEDPSKILGMGKEST